MTERWRPIHENHAIDVMAAVVRFREPLPAPVYKKAAKAVENAALEHGLKSRHVEGNIAFNINLLGGGEPLLAQPRAQIFNSAPEDGPLGSLSEQVRIDAQGIVYRSWDYVSWVWQLERIKGLMADALAVAQPIVELASIRLEYLDRFWFQGPLSAAKTDGLLRRDSDLIASHIFERRDMWHCHTGAFLPADGEDKELLQVTIDAIDQAGPGLEEPQTRWINIMTAREIRYAANEVEERPWDTNYIVDVLEPMHSEIKDALASIIQADMAAAIYLKA